MKLKPIFCFFSHYYLIKILSYSRERQRERERERFEVDFMGFIFRFSHTDNQIYDKKNRGTHWMFFPYPKSLRALRTYFTYSPHKNQIFVSFDAM